MSKPIAIFGLSDNTFVEKVMRLQKNLFESGAMETNELDTIPHLTMLVNKEFPEDQPINKLADSISSTFFDLHQFTLPVKSFAVLENSIVAKFDNSYSKQLV